MGYSRFVIVATITWIGTAILVSAAPTLEDFDRFIENNLHPILPSRERFKPLIDSLNAADERFTASSGRFNAFMQRAIPERFHDDKPTGRKPGKDYVSLYTYDAYGQRHYHRYAFKRKGPIPSLMPSIDTTNRFDWTDTSSGWKQSTNSGTTGNQIDTTPSRAQSTSARIRDHYPDEHEVRLLRSGPVGAHGEPNAASSFSSSRAPKLGKSDRKKRS